MIERIVTGLIMMVGFSFTLYMIKKWLTRLEKAVGAIERKHLACREGLPDRFDKKADKESVDKLWTRTDEHEKNIEYAKGLRNGVKA